MSSSYYNPIPGAGRFSGAVQANAERVWNAVGDIANQRQHDALYAPVNGSLRRVNAAAAQGADLTQQFDPFGNNRYTDASNPWAAFFGAPAQPWKTASYDKYDRDSYMLPEAYAGQNEYLGKTITKMIYDDETYYTQILMPIRFTNQVGSRFALGVLVLTLGFRSPSRGMSGPSTRPSRAWCPSWVCPVSSRPSVRPTATRLCVVVWLPVLSTASWTPPRAAPTTS